MKTSRFVLALSPRPPPLSFLQPGALKNMYIYIYFPNTHMNIWRFYRSLPLVWQTGRSPWPMCQRKWRWLMYVQRLSEGGPPLRKRERKQQGQSETGYSFYFKTQNLQGWEIKITDTSGSEACFEQASPGNQIGPILCLFSPHKSQHQIQWWYIS